ncbi:MAG TPA: HRDC domain-containing protein [Polyangiaceae bacterium]|nr:HRDC domain-containing protein [Polyangiaceae bacterium]
MESNAPRLTPTRLVAAAAALRDVVEGARTARRVAVDAEASGMHAYRARCCTVQLAWDDGAQVAVVDALAAPIAPLASLLGAGGPVKIVHDVAFDARLLASEGVVLGRVHDTAIAAQMLGRPATGLASLLAAELGVRIGKGMQHHDWRIRPLDDAMLAYLGSDVRHLEALERTLWSEVTAREVEEAVLEETTYRIASAVAAAESRAPPPPTYVRIKGARGLDDHGLAVLRAVAGVRERIAERQDVPPHTVASNEALLILAQGRAKTPAEIARVPGVAGHPRGGPALTGDLAQAIREAPERIPEDERAHFEPARVAPEVIKARRDREARVLAWRRAQARLRGVDEQVVLPGHCVRDVVQADAGDLEALSRVPGIGAFRVERDGGAIVRALRGEDPRA